jgi:hypothetical protein
MSCASGPKATRFRDRGDYDQFSPVAIVSVEVNKDVRWEGEKDPTSGNGGGLMGLAAGAIKKAVVDAITIDVDTKGLAEEGERIFAAGLEKLNIPAVAKQTVVGSAAYQAVKADKEAADRQVVAGGYKTIKWTSDKVILDKKFAAALASEISAGGFLAVQFRIEKDVDVGLKGSLATGNMFPRVSMFVILFNAAGQYVAYPLRNANGDLGSFTLQYKGIIDQAIDKGVNTAVEALGGDADVDNKYTMTETLPVVAGQYDVDEFYRLTLQAMELLVDKFVTVVSLGQEQYAGTYRGAK